MTDVPIRCSCGAVRGTARDVSGRSGNRLVCYCDDCQSFAHFLGRPSDVLDKSGGTDIFQMSPARLEFEAGVGNLACVRLAPRGMLRWYTDCCKTPIGNTIASHKMPFVGLIHSFMDHASDGRARDDVLGPVRSSGFARYAKEADPNARDGVPVQALVRMVPLVLMARLRGDHKRSPFFDADTGKPTVRPRTLSEAELKDVEAARDAS